MNETQKRSKSLWKMSSILFCMVLLFILLIWLPVTVQQANLSGANFSSANLSGASLVDSILKGTNLSGAKLQDVSEWMGATIQHVKGLDQSLLKEFQAKGAIVEEENKETL